MKGIYFSPEAEEIVYPESDVIRTSNGGDDPFGGDIYDPKA